jgi:hypothetical protein
VWTANANCQPKYKINIQSKENNSVSSMGCAGSKDKLSTVDDSVHAMLSHESKLAKSKGEQVKSYVPRAPHPLLQEQNNQASNAAIQNAAAIVANEDTAESLFNESTKASSTDGPVP